MHSITNKENTILWWILPLKVLKQRCTNFFCLYHELMHKVTFSVTFNIFSPFTYFQIWVDSGAGLLSVLSLKLIIRNYTLQQNSNLTTINLGPVVTGHWTLICRPADASHSSTQPQPRSYTDLHGDYGHKK